MLAAAMVGVASAQQFISQPYWNQGARMQNPYYGLAGVRAAPRARMQNPYGLGGFLGSASAVQLAATAANPYMAERQAVKEPKRISQSKTMAVLDQYMTIKGLTDGTNPITNPQYIWNGAEMVNAGTQSDVLQMMMLSQGMGGTGANNQLAWSLLNRGNTPNYIKATGSSVNVNGNSVMGYAPADPRGAEAITAMLWGGLGNGGLTAGEMLPLALAPGGFEAGTFDALMNFGSAFGGSW